MKILVFPHSMELGGSQLNAIELASAIRDRGHEVAVLSGDGRLVSRVSEAGLERIALNRGVRVRPSMRAMAQLRDLADRRCFDIVHGYEWPPGIEASASTVRRSARGVCTVMSMSVAPFLPRSLPLVVGTRFLADQAKSSGFRHVSLIEPPVDTIKNSLAKVHPLPRKELGICGSALLLVVVGRIVPELKLEGLLAACEAAGQLTTEGVHAHLLVVGDGSARERVAAAAEVANARAGHRIVHLTGELQDPRSAYAAADIVLGMGGSAIRGLSFSKPLIVQGEKGFWRILTPQTAPEFLERGWYGLGPSTSAREGSARLVILVRQLLARDLRLELGRFGRDLVQSHFSIEEAARNLEEVYQEALVLDDRPSPKDVLASVTRAIRHQYGRRIRFVGRVEPSDDFNAVARDTYPRSQAGVSD